ncbi:MULTISPECIES: hypothetical protein [Acinetobacter]|uniref:Uncharacterized protein n=1 Tax=Acinetobacter indicus TaxID=756892 RepID=A0A6C0Y6S7_9GAMM|nr:MULTISPECIES: hypothetical protein [Acinetobacter]QIC71803.1 hypothetical protein FSC09_15535 [Acinetobacter indicus]QKQ71711.1 hypothetical protein E5Y90_15895 [Acinetobacter sp. 10FS3-1]
MSQKDNLILAIQDNALLENTLVIWLYFSVVIFFVLIVAAFIMRKELHKAITSGNYAPNSQTPKLFRILMSVFFVASAVAVLASGILFFKVQDIRHTLQEQSIMLESTAKKETQAILDYEMNQAMAPITPEEMAQIDRDVRQEIDNSKRLLEEEAKKRAAKDPTTTVENELHKLMNQLKGEVDKAQGRAPAPVEKDPNKSSQENLDAVVEAIFNEPLKQLQEEEKAKKDERVASTQ